MFRTVAFLLALGAFTSTCEAIPVHPGETYRSDFDLTGSAVAGAPPYNFDTYGVDLLFDTNQRWVVGQRIYLEVHSASGDVLGGLTIAQPFPFDVDNIAGINVPITPLANVSDLVGYLLLTSINSSFDLLSASAFIAVADGLTTSIDPTASFVPAPYAPPNPDFPTWGSVPVAAAPVPGAFALFSSALVAFGLFGWLRRWRAGTKSRGVPLARVTPTLDSAQICGSVSVRAQISRHRVLAT